MKKLMLMCGPFGTRSGYGDHARDIFHSFYDSDKYDIVVWDTRWGDTPRNALDENNEKDKKIIDSLSPNHQIERQPDVYVDVRVPNEFNPIGKFNIGITAGIETTAVSAPWIEGANRMQLLIVPSQHSKFGFTNASYEKLHKLPDGNTAPAGNLVTEPPIEVVFEGEDLNIWKKLDENELKSFDIFNDINEMVKEDFAFLFTGLWGKGNYGEDRKDTGRLIKVFLETFANQENPPALILKTNGATYSVMDREMTLSKIKDVKDKFPRGIKLPNIYLIHGGLSSEGMNALYNHPKIKSMVSFSHGEGFGRPLLEATLVGLPVIASGWSGQLDFLDRDNSILLGGELGKIPQSAVWENVLIPESEWFNVHENEASKALKFAFENEPSLKKAATKLMKINREKFSHQNMTKVLNGVVDNWIGFFDERNENVMEWVGPDGKSRNYGRNGNIEFSEKQPTAVPFKLPVLEKV